MSDNPIQLYNGLTAEQWQSSFNSWVAAGNSVETFRSFMGEGPAALPAPTLTPSGPQNANEPNNFGSTLTPQQVDMAVKSLRAAGVSADKVQAALEADGLTVPTEERTDDQVAHDREWGAGPYDPSMYRGLDYRELPAQANWSLEQKMQLDAELHEYMADLRLDPNLGPSLFEHALRLSARLQSLPAAEREMWRVNGSKEIRALYNSDEELNEVAESIKTMLELPGVDHPLTAKMKSGLLADPWLWRTLAAQAEHLVNWAAARPDKPVKK